MVPETVQSPPQKVRSKTITTQIPIAIDDGGRPTLPTIKSTDGYKTKVVQSMLREYCTTHIREPPFNSLSLLPYTYHSGAVTGNKHQVIPWGAVLKDPSSWIDSTCTPQGFEWKDPSKIQVNEIFRLLDYWRDRQCEGHDPIVWVPTSPLFQNQERGPRHCWTSRQPRIEHPQDSDEEIFVLPSS